MKAVTGVFRSASDAERALAQFRELPLPEDRLALLTPSTPGSGRAVEAVPTVSGEQPGMGKTIGAVVGAAAGFSGGSLLVAVLVPGVGAVTAIGLLGAAALAAAGAAVGGVAGGKSENFMTDGLPGDEIFVYEDALRNGRSMVIAMAEDEPEAARFRELLDTEGAESVDAAREQWWIGLRSAEKEHYSTRKNQNVGNDEKFYRLGFESALHARTRGKKLPQVLAEMNSKAEEIEREYPRMDAAELFRKGYRRGRDYYEQLCNASKAA